MMQGEEEIVDDDEGQVDSDDDSDFEEEYRQDFDRGQAGQLLRARQSIALTGAWSPQWYRNDGV